MIKIHPSSLSQIMTMDKKKTSGPEVLSVGAITFCYDQAKQFVYGYQKDIKSKYLTKGIECENDAIDLYNDVFFKNYSKNISRIESDILTGECDIDTGEMIIDIKNAWSIDTFPAISERIESKEYEWQGRAYMKLYDKDLFQLAYCLVDTPENLIGYEDETLHRVSHIDPTLRVTVAYFQRDEEKEKLIEIKCKAAQEQIERFIQTITNEHAGH